MTDKRKGGRNPKASKATIGRARPGSKPLLCAVYGRGKQLFTVVEKIVWHFSRDVILMTKHQQTSHCRIYTPILTIKAHSPYTYRFIPKKNENCLSQGL